MALKLNKARNLPIGVDLGSATVKMVQLRQTDQGLELVAAAMQEIPRSIRHDPSQRMTFLRQTVRNILKNTQFRSSQCVLSLPAKATFVQHVKIPKLPAPETIKALQWELEGKLPFPTEDAIIRHVVAGDVFGEAETKQEVIVVATAKRTIEDYISLAHHAKLEIVGINIESCAIVECFARLFNAPTSTGRTTLYVDMGFGTTKVVLSHGARIVFAKNLPIGGEQLDQAVAEGLKIPIEQAHTMRLDLLGISEATAAEDELYRLLEGPLDHLAQELTLCLRYYDSVFRSQSIERVIFLGGQAYDKRLCQAIAKRLNLPAQVGDPLVRIARLHGAVLPSGQPQPDWAVAVGLGLGTGQAA